MDLHCKIVTSRSIALKLLRCFSREAKRGAPVNDIRNPHERRREAIGNDRWLQESDIESIPSK